MARSATARTSAGTPLRAADSGRRSEILDIAASLFADQGYARTSLKDISDACGILPGSLYHHFDSKESIAVELLEAWWADVDEVGRLSPAQQRIARTRPTTERVITLAVALAETAVRHRAALNLSTVEPRSGAAPELVEAARNRSLPAIAAMRDILTDGQAAGAIKAAIDITLLSEELCLVMFRIGHSTLHSGFTPKVTAETLCLMLLEGIAERPPSDRRLSRSTAMTRAEAAIRDWDQPDDDPDERRALLRATARAEFARRGYDSTTIRDISAAAGIGTGTVYRVIESKDSLFASIMTAFYQKMTAAHDAVVGSDSTAVEKLDALAWVNISVMEHFPEEFAIQAAWFNSVPPETSMPVDAIRRGARLIRDIVTEGRRNGELSFTQIPMGLLVSCVRNLLWLPESDGTGTEFRQADPLRELAHSRATLLRGAATSPGRRTPAPVRQKP
jgi:AcrR family transcriptional regulator